LRLYLTFHHHTILVNCDEEDVLEKLQDEFHFFHCREESTPEIIVELRKEDSPIIPPMVAVKLLENSVVYRLAGRQYIDYFGEALAILEDDARVKIYSQSKERLFELGFLAIHSLLGQALDKSGLCRLHAVAVSLSGKNAVVMLPSKGGKSTLLKNLLENPELKIISDDMPLVDKKGGIHPFPSKMSLNAPPLEGPLAKLKWHEFKRYHFPSKWTASLAQLKDRIEKHSSDQSTILLAGFRLSQGESIISEVPKWKMIGPLLEHMIIGHGLPQIIEMFLHFNFTDFIKMFWHACLRTRSAYSLVLKSRCYYFYMGPDIAYNSQLLLELLYAEEPS
jgi:hypothetical protein